MDSGGNSSVTTVIISAFGSSVAREWLPWKSSDLSTPLSCPLSSPSGQAMQTSTADKLFDSLLDSFGSANRTLGSAEMSDRIQTWMFTIAAACLVGLSGVVPLAIIPVEMGLSLKQNRGSSKTLRLLLGFAVGGLLGDVFLHLLPEAWDHAIKAGPDIRSQQIWLGVWAILGIFLFTICEMIFAASKSTDEQVHISQDSQLTNNNSSSIDSSKENLQHQDCNDHHQKNGLQNGEYYSHIIASKENKRKFYISNGINGANKNTYKKRNNNCTSFSKSHCNGDLHEKSLNGIVKNSANSWHKLGGPEKPGIQDNSAKKEIQHIHVTGYLNLLANSIDNFTHGLAVAASFLVGTKMGVLTTLAILIHEVPHEVGDYAILLRSGFTRWDAAKAQLSTASIGILGAIATLCADSAEAIGAKTAWILPFTAGGFINIALVNVLPDLLKEEDPWESIKQVFCIFSGIGIMLLVNIIIE